MKRNPALGKHFVRALLDWFARAMRPFPWRETYDPYGVWISEIMLQQTQAERGARYHEAWMRRFPDVRSVAEADEEAILAAWEGLGYYSRARNLHAAAKQIMREHNGAFPQSLAAIRALPGVGDYTAGAIAAIAFNISEPAVDANVMRIFARICDIDLPVTDKAAKALVAGTVREIMPDETPRMFNQALMELGALVCGKTPKCGICPVKDFCRANRLGIVSERPVKTGKVRYSIVETAAGIIGKDDRVFIRKRPPGGLWAGLWEFPGGRVRAGETPENALVRLIRDETGFSVSECAPLAVVRHGYTTVRVTMHGFLCGMDGRIRRPKRGAAESAWVTRAEIAGYAFAAGHRKLLERLGWKAATEKRLGVCVSRKSR